MGLRAHEGATGAAAAEGVRVSRQSDQMRARWADPAFRAKQAAARSTPEYRATYANRRRPRLKMAPPPNARTDATDALISDIRVIVARRDAEIAQLRVIIRRAVAHLPERPDVAEEILRRA